MLVGGILPADQDRLGAPIRTGLPYVGSAGALDMVNFGPRDTVPEKFKGRKFVVHNANVTLMRTTRDENRAAGEWIGGRLNQMDGPVRFLLPEGGVSGLDGRARRSMIPRRTRPCSRPSRKPCARPGVDLWSVCARTSTNRLLPTQWSRPSAPYRRRSASRRERRRGP